MSVRSVELGWLCVRPRVGVPTIEWVCGGGRLESEREALVHRHVELEVGGQLDGVLLEAAQLRSPRRASDAGLLDRCTERIWLILCSGFQSMPKAMVMMLMTAVLRVAMSRSSLAHARSATSVREEPSVAML